MAKTAQQQATCRCGCGAPVERRYRPGHDSLHIKRLASAVQDGSMRRREATAQLDSAALRNVLRARLDAK